MQHAINKANDFNLAINVNVTNINSANIHTAELLNDQNSNRSNPRQNQLLSQLGDLELSNFENQLELVYLLRNQILCESGDTPIYMYFPTTAIISIQYLTDMGSSSEVAVVGNDGVVGVSLFMSNTKTINQAQVYSEGYSYRLHAHLVKNLISHSNIMLTLLLRYSHSMFTQVAQIAVCNRHHSVDQQLSRRLLMSLDRINCNDIMMTQETIAKMLGVRRESVTEAALKLQDAGAIKYNRGHITVLNRKLLEKQSCECYAMNKKEHDKLSPCQS